tara:strand:- start:5241 stop:5465 length:225 start_codon:yes stop_codon:yes gene_type:complete
MKAYPRIASAQYAISDSTRVTVKGVLFTWYPDLGDMDVQASIACMGHLRAEEGVTAPLHAVWVESSPAEKEDDK